MNRARAVMLVAVVGVAAVSTATAPVSAAAPRTTPTVTVSPNAVKVERDVRVDGRGFRPGTNVKAELCGRDLGAGSAGCAQAASRVVRTWTDGSLHLLLTAVPPPVRCPCAVLVTDIERGTSASAGVVLRGAPRSGPATAALTVSTADVRVVATRVEARSDLGALVGGVADRTLVVTVRNAGGLPARGVRVDAAWGPGARPTHVIAGVGPTTIPAGATRTVAMPFQVDALTFGTFAVVGSAGTAAGRSGFSTSTSQRPWGLVVLAAGLTAVLVLLLMATSRRSRSRYPRVA